MWEPWVGRYYEVARLLLLGESAYSWTQNGREQHPSPWHSRVTVEEAITDFSDAPSFAKKLTRGVTGQECLSRQEREMGWARVAFTNYVPETVGSGARARPTRKLWKKAEEEFPHLLGRLQPKNVIVLGKEMWDSMPPTQLRLTDDVQGYSCESGMVLCWAVPHPSAGLTWQWLAGLVDFLGKRK